MIPSSSSKLPPALNALPAPWITATFVSASRSTASHTSASWRCIDASTAFSPGPSRVMRSTPSAGRSKRRSGKSSYGSGTTPTVVFGSMVLTGRLVLDRVEDDVFVNREPTDEHHVFGGLVVAHALGAATATVEGRLPCSLHASFVVAGKGAQPIRYEVERTPDGGSFSTRRVIARQ